ncbi:helix-turn-helix domain-containing protein [Streptomyces sp. NPDC023998]|uniref:PucR family transcriptional regulator n=1 Tax=Streptomyces sp. NPDC023998 TaxID=3154597 RepID=UPI0033D57550
MAHQDGLPTPPAQLPPAAEAGVSLRQLLTTLGEPVLELQAAPKGLDVEVREVGILDLEDPEDPAQARTGELLLAVGARGRAALPSLRAAGAAGAAAVAVRAAGQEQTAMLAEAAADAGVALLTVRQETRWERLDSLVRAVLGSEQSAAPAGHETGGDLFSLAQTTAVLTGGIVSIEDTAHRVLAYSRSSDEVDALRRLSILGWQGPEAYLSKLREWGVFEHLRTSGTVIAVDEHPELGIRRRLAVGIRAGTRPLGTIWVQEGSRPLTPRSQDVLLGAARVAAPHLIRLRREVSPDMQLTRTLLAGLLDGSSGPQLPAVHLGLDPRLPAAVVGFALKPRSQAHAGGGGGGEEGEGLAELTRTEITGVIAVHAAARHHNALVVPVGTRIYVLLPELPAGITASVLRGWSREILQAAESHVGVSLRAAIGPVVAELLDTTLSRREADRVLDAMACGAVTADVASLDEVRAEVLVAEILATLAQRPDLRDPRLTELAERDERSGTRYTQSLLAYLDAFGDIPTAAARLHIHRNTLRYRIRRAQELTGLDLSHPQQRLLAMLQLRMP